MVLISTKAVAIFSSSFKWRFSTVFKKKFHNLNVDKTSYYYLQNVFLIHKKISDYYLN